MRIDQERCMDFATPFADRRAAGRVLARALHGKPLTAPVVLALARGGVPVAAETAAALRAPLDIVLVRKIGVPLQRELAVAAVVDGSEPEVMVNEDVATLAGITAADIAAEVNKELAEIERRRNIYLQGRARVPVEGRTVILVDDGIATGTSVRAALRALKRKGPKAVIVAVPVAPSETIEALRKEADEIVCLRTPDPFFAIGMHYADFRQVSDDDVVRCLAEQAAEFALAAREETTKVENSGVAALKP
jgi:putative phosphoribosyl transferase